MPRSLKKARDPFQTRFIQLLRTWKGAASRASLAKCQEALSEQTGIPLGTIKNWCSKDTRPSVAHLETIAEATDANLHWLLAGQGDPFVALEDAASQSINGAHNLYEGIVAEISARNRKLSPERVKYLLGFGPEHLLETERRLFTTTVIRRSDDLRVHRLSEGDKMPVERTESSGSSPLHSIADGSIADVEFKRILTGEGMPSNAGMLRKTPFKSPMRPRQPGSKDPR